MYIALICPTSAGHLNPIATLGRELVRRGHRVGLVGSPNAVRKAESSGLEWLAVGLPEYESGVFQRALDQLAELQGLPALKMSGEIFRMHTEVLLRDAPDVLRAAGVEALIVDQATLAGITIADVLRLPFVIVCNGLALNQEPRVPPSVLGWRYRRGLLARLRNRAGNQLLGFAVRPIVRTISAFRARHGLPPFVFDSTFEAGLAQIAQQPSFFDYPRAELPTHFHYTGPWHDATSEGEPPPFPWEKLDGRPLVYASLGTMQNRLQPVFQAILEGCAELPVQLVLSLGRDGSTWDGPVPPNAIVVPFAPQLALLERASLLITHAGLNTVLGGLACGLPMLCLPVANEQPATARRVEWLGAGEVLEPRRASAKRVRAMVEKLLAGDYRRKAQTCGALMRRMPGVARAADIAEQAFRTGQRVESV